LLLTRNCSPERNKKNDQTYAWPSLDSNEQFPHEYFFTKEQPSAGANHPLPGLSYTFCISGIFHRIFRLPQKKKWKEKTCRKTNDPGAADYQHNIWMKFEQEKRKIDLEPKMTQARIERATPAHC
jgi:hypothetical protein